jgi:hypothetical protein
LKLMDTAVAKLDRLVSDDVSEVVFVRAHVEAGGGSMHDLMINGWSLPDRRTPDKSLQRSVAIEAFVGQHSEGRLRHTRQNDISSYDDRPVFRGGDAASAFASGERDLTSVNRRSG